MKKIALIGSTGSIGRQVAEVCLRHPDKFKITAVCAGSESEAFSNQIKLLCPEYSAVSPDPAEFIKKSGADMVFNAACGFAGLKYSVAAINASLPLALANKETLVCGGELIIAAAAVKGAPIIPVDSEHSAIWQCLGFGKTAAQKLVITASGGPFLNAERSELEKVTPEQALSHPVWKMGAKISVDSATLMNKAYEVIEAHVLYGTPYRDISAVLHPQSIVHSLVGFRDGAYIAQLGYPTMELPIQLALSYPERLDCASPKLDFSTALKLDFSPLKQGMFPCFDLGLQCGKAGGTMPTSLNAADETAVAAFLNGEIKFTDIFKVVKKTVEGVKIRQAESTEALVRADGEARRLARRIIGGKL